MANKGHVALLKAGLFDQEVKVWNEWRQTNAGIEVDLLSPSP